MGNSLKAIELKAGREKSVRNRHPWIFSGAVNKYTGELGNGETVKVFSSSGEALGYAAYSAQSQIRARMWTWDANQEINTGFFMDRIAEALQLRKNLIPESETDAVRLINAESDGLPGLIVDRYADHLVMQVLSAGMEYWRETITDLLPDLTGIANLYERSDVEVRLLEGLPERCSSILGDASQKPVRIHENGLQFQVDLVGGQKTGFFIDQRKNRLFLRNLAKGKRVLDCFCYSGGFTVSALAGDARHVVAVDSSQDALNHAMENVRINAMDENKVDWIAADVFKELRLMRDKNEKFDMIILDPPKFAPTIKQVERASRGYKDINLLAFKLLNPGGTLITFSCSGGVSEDLFQKIVFGSALDAGVNARIIARLHQGVDHPVSLNFPEGAYLKGLVCHI